MNNTLQSFNFSRSAGGAALTDPAQVDAQAPDATLAKYKGVGASHHFLAGGKGALPADSRQIPWTGDYVFSSGDLVEDLTHNFFLETGARNGKLKVYQTVEHPAARALTGYLLVRGGVHQVAYARALERLTGVDMMKAFPAPRIPTDKIPECQPHIKKGLHRILYHEIAAVFNEPHPETGEDFVVEDGPPEGVLPNDLPPQTHLFAPDYAPQDIAEIAQRLRKAAGFDEPTGKVANAPEA
ncbi:MAG TPA: manganese catalase family protein [Baekduia sp.]|uniref:manganese catalase family protein n=1 Tax=Baekduia sp. TaxID=2600305 RepID=UPI002B88046A|nr:manganese catalase family protein [Baekduia sp.]HMJ35067.1 manganese catalase family protein [Baekduia sp.]